jgi:MOSC domain-containing protein
MTIVGTVQELWRYPVKSMGGERIEQATLGAAGLPGDRGWAVRDEAAGEIRGGKKLPGLMLCSARYLREPDGRTVPPAEITLPDGATVTTDDRTVAERLTALLGRAVTLWPIRPADDREHYRRGLPDKNDMIEELRDIFGRLPDEPLPDLSVFPPEILEFTSPLGTYFDAFPLHVLTTASLAALAAQGPADRFDRRRFRPNVLVETDAALRGLVESGWASRPLRVGEAVATIQMPTVRCSMISQPQPGLAKDPQVLRAVVRDADQNLGIYATITTPGTVRVGDPVELV